MVRAQRILDLAQRDAFEWLATPVWATDPATVRVVWANSAALAFWRANSLEALRAQDMASTLTASMRERFASVVEMVRAGETVDTVHTLYPRGSPKRVKSRLTRAQWPEDGRFVVLQQSQEVETEVAEEVLRAHLVVAQAPNAVGLFDFDGRPIWENDGARLTFANLSGARPFLGDRFVRPDSLGEIKAATEAGQTFREAVQLRTTHGERWGLVYACSTTDPVTGQSALMFGHSDIHEFKCAELAVREAKEAAELANRSKSEFVANMSHEIRTPMNGVLGALQVLERSRLDGKQRRLVGTIQRSAKTLLAVLNDILDLSRIEAGKLQVETIAFDIVRGLEDLVTLHSQAAEGKGLGLQSSFPKAMTRTVLGDPVRVAQVVSNFLSNAVKFTSDGHVHLIVSVVSQDDEHVCVRVAVKDTGCGMTPEQQERVFSAFEQADGSTTRRHGGTGLGLTISRRLVEMMGGRIGLDSKLGFGSTFWFEIPFPVPPPAAPTMDLQPAHEVELGSQDLVGASVLLVEDNLINQQVALAMLETVGCRPECALDGAEALQLVAQGAFDLILMDCQMPGMDGFTATRSLRENGNSVPIIALTANAMTGDRDRCLEAGMDDFVAKPFALEDLAETMKRWLGATHSKPPSSASTHVDGDDVEEDD